MTITSESSETSNEQAPPPVNEADLQDNKGEPKESKLLECDESGEGSEGKTKEEEKEVSQSPGDEPGEGVSTKYRLRGVVVHSGQASGGHYYSFVYLKYVCGTGSGYCVKWCILNIHLCRLHN